MGVPDARLRDYGNNCGLWNGYAYVPYWRDELRIFFINGHTEPTPRQVRIVRAVLDYPHDLRGLVETSVFDHDQTEVSGNVGFGGTPEEVRQAVQAFVPQLTESSQIWNLISGAEIHIYEYCNAEHQGAVDFKMTFACSWDDEHGLGLRFRDWEIVGFEAAAG